MPNNRYSEYASNLGFPKTSRDKQGDEGTPSKLKGMIYDNPAKGPKDPGGDMPMNMKTKQYRDPAGFKTQPRDRSWGMRQADGLAQCKGLGGPGEDQYESTFVKR